MSQQTDECSVCLIELESDRWTLPCSHQFHLQCIREVYRVNLNRVDYDTSERLVPRCPNCRTQFHSRDLPQESREEQLNHPAVQEVLNTPNWASMPAEQRPMRLVRNLFVVRPESIRNAIEELASRRAVILERQRQAEQESQPISSISSESSVSLRDCRPARKGPVLHSSSSSSSSGSSIRPVVRVHFGAITPTPPQSQVAASQVARSSSQVPPNSSQILSQSQDGNDSAAGQEQRARVLQIKQELQEVQMRIGVLQNQLATIQSFRPNNRDPEEIVIEDNESVNSDDVVLLGTFEPIRIIRHVGRGQHIRYLLEWSDGSITMNRVENFQSCERDKQILIAYRRLLRRDATRRFRTNRRSQSSDSRDS
ncbi:E3 ubiquitin- ligase SDIR1-like [Olea europaea subsp. europaea]|uniref:E3 ubiquitin- ligase SDIR1-like n=1 Tax=Olea europaea subsp. europaea TaxID=158383 RepID=A0A8S0RDJ2_OLEEU|nr:E3 ubiquitin- ligase SDIR1-like [Olea europaea subsp. europaea]